MVTTTTFRDDEVVLGGYRLPIKGPVKVHYVPQFPGKVTIGNTTRADQTVADEWVSDDWRDGLLIFQMDQEANPGRFWWSTLDTRTRRKLHLLPKVTTIAPPEGVTDPPGMIVEYDDDLLVCFKGEWYQWDESATPDAWTAVLFDTETVPTDWVVYKGKLYLACGASYWTWDGANEAEVELPADYWALFDYDPYKKLIKTTHEGVVKASDDGAIWVDEVGGEVLDVTVNALVPFRNQSDEPQLYAATSRGLYGLDIANKTNALTSLQILKNTSGGLSTTVWNGDLYFPDSLALWRFPKAGTINDVGFDQDDGLPPLIRGKIVKVTGTPNYLIAAVDATSRVIASGSNPWKVQADPFYGDSVFARTYLAGASAIFAYNNKGWHTLYRATASGSKIDQLLLSTCFSDQRRLWFNDGNSLCYVLIPEGNYDPTQDKSYQYASSGEWISAWFDSGITEHPKLASSIKLRFSPGSITGTDTDTGSWVEVYYGLDGLSGDDTLGGWSFLGNCTVDNTDSRGICRLAFSAPSGEHFYSIRFKLVFHANSACTTSPVLLFSDLRYKRVPSMLWGYTFTVETQEYEYLQDLWQTIRTLADDRQTYAFGFRADAEDEKIVFIHSIQGTRNPGNDTVSSFTLTVVEIDREEEAVV